LNSLRKITQDSREILVVDFSDLKENEMMKLVSDSRALLIKEARPQRLLIIVNDKNYVTNKVMRHMESDQIEALKFSERQAIVGMSLTQKMILKGYNVIFNRDIKAFESQEEAMKYLLEG
jgi:hypothetical protein